MAKNIHIIGIGGIGTSSLAQIFHERGGEVSGSDLGLSNITKSLKLKGIKVYTGHNPKNIKKTGIAITCGWRSPSIKLKKGNSLIVKSTCC